MSPISQGHDEFQSFKVTLLTYEIYKQNVALDKIYTN